jgi:hypothetical protein
MKNLAYLLSILTISVFIASCSSKEVQQQVSMASNRVMAYVIRGDHDANITEEIDQGIQAGLQKAYSAQLMRLEFESTSLVEDPSNLYQIGRNRVDDLFVFSSVEVDSQLDITATLYNGSNLKTVSVLKFSVPLPQPQAQGLSEDELKKLPPPPPPLREQIAKLVQRTSLENYPNPNIYPKADPIHFANLLFVFSQEAEKSLTTRLSCDTAEDVLKFYPSSRELYEMGQKSLEATIAGRQEEAHLVTTRLQVAKEKEAILESCRLDEQKTFELIVDFGSIDPSSHEAITRAIAAADLESILKQYSAKPVKFTFSVDPSSGSMNLLVDLRFDQARYSAWTKNRIPSRFREFNILSLDPYFALMQKLVVMRASLPESAPQALRVAFTQMKMTLAFTTLLNGQAMVGVEGRYDPRTKSIAMAYPNSVYLELPQYEAKTITGKSPEIFQEKAWIALGNCKTVDGARTEDGLLFSFFGIECT